MQIWNLTYEFSPTKQKRTPWVVVVGDEEQQYRRHQFIIIIHSCTHNNKKSEENSRNCHKRRQVLYSTCQPGQTKKHTDTHSIVLSLTLTSLHLGLAFYTLLYTYLYYMLFSAPFSFYQITSQIAIHLMEWVHGKGRSLALFFFFLFLFLMAIAERGLLWGVFPLMMQEPDYNTQLIPISSSSSSILIMDTSHHQLMSASACPFLRLLLLLYNPYSLRQLFNSTHRVMAYGRKKWQGALLRLILMSIRQKLQFLLSCLERWNNVCRVGTCAWPVVYAKDVNALLVLFIENSPRKLV